jgi:ethanolamine transporter EutH
MGLSITREIRYGLISCLIGTVAMDAVVVLEYSITGQPLDTSFVLFGRLVGGGVMVGVFLHLLFGSMLGILFGILISRFDAFRIDSLGKGLKVGVMAGLVTIPLGCVPFALVVGVPLTTMIPFVAAPHLVWGLVMGWLTSHLLISRGA